ncbi:hypothetical protein ADIS_2361 [Lunatimonas lonarensis]|uniref:Uncharacterized protein n=1 Tax=Lunatimonas lonarensis TaxID=1232681 RepID=R7ZSN4_9BACT|nr:hypothetical protein ADIS_2361 [Lunatimonas lonarensis]
MQSFSSANCYRVRLPTSNGNPARHIECLLIDLVNNLDLFG